MRPTRVADLPAAYEVFTAAIGELFDRHGFPPPGAPLEVFAAQHAHLLEHDADLSHVAVDEGRVVAFVAALARDDAWFLSSLFVLPSHQGRGLGRALLERAWGEGYARRHTLADSIQPVSNGLYSRFGLIPTTPALRLTGRPERIEETTLEDTAPDPVALALLDAAAYGFDRGIDHRHWAAVARATLWLRAGEPAAYSYLWPDGRIGPVAAVDGPSAADAVRGELARVNGATTLIVPGTCAEVVEVAVQARLRITGPPGLLLLARGTPHPRALVLAGYTLF
jgi:GNAT superfamily N-acetyltransferase